MNKILSRSLFIVAISSTVVYASDSETESTIINNAETIVTTAADSDSGTAIEGSAGKSIESASTKLEYMNPVDPDFWAEVFNTETHHVVHAAMANPAQHRQMMDPQFYAQMMNPAIWMKWMNPESYSTFVNPATWMAWMNPEAFSHSLDPATYSQMMQPEAWSQLFEKAASNSSAYIQPNAESGNSNSTNSKGMGSFFNWFNMAAIPLPSAGQEAAQ